MALLAHPVLDLQKEAIGHCPDGFAETGGQRHHVEVASVHANATLNSLLEAVSNASCRAL